MGKVQGVNRSYEVKTEPWAHQLEALEYLYERDTAALYTDMGTGKSKIMLDLVVNRGFKTVLIVCTNKGCSVWEKQIRLHTFIDDTSVLQLAGRSTTDKVTTVRQKLVLDPKAGRRRPMYVVIVNYEGVWRKPFADLLLKAGIDCVICDESHRIKSPSSKCSWFLTRIGKRVQHKYLVTGTPIAENPMDVYAQYRFLDPTIFGTNFSKFKARYQNIDAQKSMRVGFPVLVKDEPYVNLDELYEKMFSCAFYAKSSLQLPKRMNITRSFQMGSKAQGAYKELEDEGVLELRAGTLEVNNALSMAVRKQQITSGFVPVEDEEGNTKVVRIDRSRVETLEDILESLPPMEPIVVFAKFRRDLQTIQRICRDMGRGYSEISGRMDTEAAWQAGETAVIGVQYTSGSESVDLTRARYCVYYSLTYSLAQYEQSKKRVHRPGQTRPVVYYHIIAQKKRGRTIDEVILAALKSKKDVVQYIMENPLG